MIKGELNLREKDIKNLEKGLVWLKNTDLVNISAGKHIISDDMYVNIDEYRTGEKEHFEAHREYADIQYLIKGEEIIEVSELKDCKPVTEYDKDKDICFYDSDKSKSYHIKNGEFIIFLPNDAHKPCLKVKEPSWVKKAVVKIKL